MRRQFVPFVLLALAPSLLCAAKWRMSYFYDKDRSTLHINDLQFPSAERGVAVGYLEENGDFKPVSVTTDDGGAHWAVSSLKQIPASVFFLNSTLGWMPAAKGVWLTTDAGRTWHEARKSPDSLAQIYFLDEQRGFAVGAHKSAYQSSDGGKTWEPIAVAAEPHSNPEYTTYNCIAFANGKAGFISGYSAPPRKEEAQPEWMKSGEKAERREWPHLTIMLSTSDGGQTWEASSASMFGRITHAMLLPDGRGLGLLEFTDHFQWPSEVHQLDGATGKSTTVYHAPDRAITDVLLTQSGAAYIAGVEVAGKLQHSPIPRKLKILTSDDLADWREMEVDYRADAVRAILRAAHNGSLWAATDTGMILKLATDPAPVTEPRP